MTEYTTKPAQFRLPQWAHEFLAQEASATGATKTDVLVEALETYKEKRFDELMVEGYRELADENLRVAREWDFTLLDGLEDDPW
ncbi:MAG: hypothetical protein Q7W16_01835 [Coriobacteriia bacterium]|nr:hypothetical protein [Coriobacteriia bacterium]